MFVMARRRERSADEALGMLGRVGKNSVSPKMVGLPQKAVCELRRKNSSPF